MQAFVHKSEVHVMDATPVGGAADLAPSGARLMAGRHNLLSSLSWVSIDGHRVLVVGRRGGFELWEPTGTLGRVFSFDLPPPEARASVLALAKGA